MKHRLGDLSETTYLNDPQQLVYFLVDQNYKVSLAEDYFRRTVAARHHSLPYNINNILTEYTLPDDYDYFPMAVLEGTDRQGDPIQVFRTGVADCWSLLQRHGREVMIHHAIYNQELDCRGVWRDDYEFVNRKPITQFTVLFDLQGLNRNHMRPTLLQVCGTIARVLQDHYPALEKRILILHAPPIFKWIWKLVRHFFDASLRDLMVVATDDKDSQHLIELYIDRDVVPHVLHPGGLDGPLARGYEHVHLEGGPLPELGVATSTAVAMARRRRQEKQHQQQQYTIETNNNAGSILLGSKPTTVRCQRLFGGTWMGHGAALDDDGE
jgi:hypothetical protein